MSLSISEPSREWGGPVVRLPEVFRRTAGLFPDRIAILDHGQVWTYREIDRLSDDFARRLAASGVRPRDCVGLWTRRSASCLTAMLGILKAGATYVPLDAEFPRQRVTDVLADCQAVGVVGDRDLLEQIADLAIQRIDVASVLTSAPQTGGEPLASVDAGTLDDLAYIIYTSGTTGRSKGVPITHENIGCLIEAEVELFHVQATDRVFHGFSMAFDASLEEIWLAFRSGAALVIGSADDVRSGPQLAEFLTANHVTVLSCVPTLLSLIDQDCPTVQLLIVGGEACPEEIVRRWSRPGRRMVNTYGPTEATVIATWSDVFPDQPVRIGKPIARWATYVVDEALHPVPVNTAGELLIGGPGVAPGYLNRPELTAEKFVQLPWATERLYRTGDLVRLDEQGELEFLGRIDAQVKLRGFRIELGEIEARLLSIPGVVGSAATVHRDPDGADQLAGYVILRSGTTWDEAACRRTLRERLPPYMVPGVLVVLDRFPTLSSGKLDRKSLPRPQQPVLAPSSAPAHLTPTEVHVWNAWQPFFPGEPIDQGDSFFDLGGQSLLATKLVSELRRRAEWSTLSVTEIYKFPTLAGFAGRLDEIAARSKAHEAERASATSTASPPPSPKPQEPVSQRSRRHFWCGCAQFVSIYLFLVFTLPFWFPVFTAWDLLVEQDHAHQLFISILLASSLFYLLLPIQLGLALAVKWLVIGRCKPGRYPLWGTYYFRFWFVQQVTRLFPTSHLRGMPWLNFYFRLMGAKIGRNVHLATDAFVAFDLLSIGDDTSIEHDSTLCTATVEGGWLILDRIDIGARCRVGARAWIGQGSRIGDQSELEDGGMLPPHSVVNPDEYWFGSPARPATPENEQSRSREYEWPAHPAPSPESPLKLHLLYALGIVVLSLFPTFAVLPGAFFLGLVDTHYCDFTVGYGDLWKIILALPVATGIHVLVQTSMIAAAKWILIGRLQPGIVSVHSPAYVRKWLVDSLMHLSLDMLFPMYSTLYLNPWLRLLGAKLGKNVEVSTVEGWNPDLVNLEEGVFVADAVCLGTSEVHRGWALNRPVSVGRNSFLGNSAIVPAGTTLGEKTLVGVLSKSPPDPIDAARVDASWLGIPAMFLPHREVNVRFDAAYTYAPPLRLRVLRATIEFFRIVLPESLMIFTIFLAFQFASDLLHHETVSDGVFLLLFPLLIGAAGLLSAGFTIALKWLIVGQYRPQERPLWSTFVWRSEFVNCLHEHLAMPMLGMFLMGTPLMPFYFRMLGARIGKRCYFDSANLTEFDLIVLGDDAALNADCDPQTHLFEDRVMKMSYVKIGEGCTVGSRTIVLYDAELVDHTTVLGNSLIMKGEHLPPQSRWCGSPAERVDEGASSSSEAST